MQSSKELNIESNVNRKLGSMSYSDLEFDLSLHGHLLDVDETLVSKGFTLLNLQNKTIAMECYSCCESMND
jgi:hypothetical protein